MTLDAGAAGVVERQLAESARVMRELRGQAPVILAAAASVSDSFRAGGRLYACGNGGSACDAVHLAEELVARYQRERPGLPAHHLIDGPTLTCWSNDYDFAGVFERQVRAMVRSGDVLVAISTSGNSPNVLRAAGAARELGAKVVGLSGRSGGELAALCHHCVRVPSGDTARVQEGHAAVIHLLCELIEGEYFSPAP
ncbi:MAG: D-sedoheptulose-7-phosphate isomerase [Longimicrobiaceae bacterium]